MFPQSTQAGMGGAGEEWQTGNKNQNRIPIVSNKKVRNGEFIYILLKMWL